ncbi:hypothetical protein BV25DRAFT_782549 [Artomyces pyxidatus]|uniref:Uncharacterized protein n=1 Tax=Artomyces pyxidatus TaxID=48021 RepID=A0ACB8SYV0_9AGAM|nr:hypothetical protein BV25DRAFT_782549 [Artomyces pyxidatus]
MFLEVLASITITIKCTEHNNRTTHLIETNTPLSASSRYLATHMTISNPLALNPQTYRLKYGASIGGRRQEYCEPCGLIFSRAYEFQRHLRSTAVHTARKTHTCDACNKAYSRSDALQRHQRLVCGWPVLPLRNQWGKQQSTRTRGRTKNRSVTVAPRSRAYRHVVGTQRKLSIPIDILLNPVDGVRETVDTQRKAQKPREQRNERDMATASAASYAPDDIAQSIRGTHGDFNSVRDEIQKPTAADVDLRPVAHADSAAQDGSHLPTNHHEEVTHRTSPPTDNNRYDEETRRVATILMMMKGGRCDF